MEQIVTYLEMTGPHELNAGRPVPEVTLDHVDGSSPLIPTTQARIGAPYKWRSATRSDEEWAQWLAHPLRRYWLIRYGPEVAGIVDLEPQPGGQVEITTFGLLPEFVGKGLGGHALTLAVRQAWAVEPADGEPVRRVWLHTSSADNPSALPNYRKRGFRPFKTRTEQLPDTP
jgi:GNAT superfamily N-acetyltransferase